MADNNASPIGESRVSPKIARTRVNAIFKRSIDEIFESARTIGHRLTPDDAMKELDDALEATLEALDNSEASIVRPSRPLRIDVVAARQEIHRYAVDVFYRTYFPRTVGMEGRPRRGATRLSLEYLDKVLKLSMQGKNPALIARKLGQSGPQAPDRIGKQVRIAEKRYAEIVANIRKIAEVQDARMRVWLAAKAHSRTKKKPKPRQSDVRVSSPK